MNINASSGNGKRLVIDSKHTYKKCKKTTPSVRFSTNVLGNYVNSISYIQGESYKTERIKNVYKYVIPHYKSMQLLARGTILETISGKYVQITSINKANLYTVGVLVEIVERS